jgi:hypothetical protein
MVVPLGGIEEFNPDLWRCEGSPQECFFEEDSLESSDEEDSLESSDIKLLEFI